VLKKARIVTFTSQPASDVPVQDMNGKAARLNLPADTPVPDPFSVLIVFDGLLCPTLLRWRTGGQIGAEFVGSQHLQPPAKMDAIRVANGTTTLPLRKIR
jgi:hypothetical protein